MKKWAHTLNSVCWRTVLAAVFCCNLALGQNSPAHNRVPKPVSDRIEQFLSDSVSDFKVVRTEDGRLEYTYNCRNYFVHSRDKLGRIGKPLQSFGPSVDGLRLRLGRVDEEPVSAYGGGRTVDVRSGDYYLTYSNTYSLANNAGFIIMSYDFGVRTNPDILAGFRTVLTADGEEIHRATEIKEGSLTPIANAVNKVLKAHSLDAEATETATDLSWEFHTRNYLGHEVNEDGEVAAQVQTIHGPDREGFIIRIWKTKQLAMPRPRGLSGESVSFSRTRTRFWQRYLATYAPLWRPVEGSPPNRAGTVMTSTGTSFHLEILYGPKMDKAILEEVVAALNKVATPPSRF